LSNQFQNHAPTVSAGINHAAEGAYVETSPPQSRAQAGLTQPPSTPNLDFISTDSREAEYTQALKHSTKVKFWKFLFPLLGLGVIAIIAGTMVIKSVEVPEVAIESIEVNDGKLVMENPKLNGFDKAQRPYNLTASRAIQDASNPNQVELEEINAQLPMSDDLTATITAGNGVYDADAKTLELTKSVNLVTSSGMTLKLKDASVDIGNSIMHTNNPIDATSPQADITSDAMMVEDGGNKLIFEGRVRMTLRPDELRKADNQNE
jgi:lipopolysaccharide export system protein LptC